MLGGGAFRLRFVRRVSWRPGAEGAVDEEGVVRLVGCEEGGAMRRACWGEG